MQLLGAAFQGPLHIDISVKDEAGNVTRNSDLSFDIISEQIQQMAQQLNNSLMSKLGDVTKRVVLVDSPFSLGGVEWGALKLFFGQNNIDYRMVSSSGGEQWDSIDKQVERVKRTVDDYVKSDKEKVAVVGWGLGGIVAKEYLRKYSADLKVAKFVTIGTPNCGINSFGQVPQALALYICVAPAINILSKTGLIDGIFDSIAKLSIVLQS